MRLPTPALFDDRMTVAVFIAVIAHVALVLGVSFEREPPPPSVVSSLDIVLVQNRRAVEEPDDAELFAQQNSDGGSDQEQSEKPSTPVASELDAPHIAQVASASPTATVEPAPSLTTLTRKSEPVIAPRVMTTTSSTNTQQVAASPSPRPREKPKRLRRPEVPARTAAAEQANPPLTATQLVTNGLAMASMTTELNRRIEAYANKPRRKWISSRTRELKYAAYMEAWRAKVERIGNLNYPDEARRRQLSGKLQLDVALKPDGSIYRIKVRRSSGKRVLDDAAIRIVKLAAPFSKFPESFRDEVDVLHIERTWQFLSNNRLASR